MTNILLAALIALCLGLLIWGFRREGGIYRYPFLASAVVLGWIVPQLIGLRNDSSLPAWGLEMTIIMTALCLGMCYLGDRAAERRPFKGFRWSFSERRLLWVAAVLAVVGAYFFWRISRLPDELKAGAWSGLPVRYLFFASLMRYGLMLAAVLYFRKRSKWALAVMTFCLLMYADRILIAARRATIVEVGAAVLIGLWFGRKWALPRPAMAAVLVLGALFVASTGDYRGKTQRGEPVPVREVAAIDYVGNLERYTQEGGSEVRNAVFNIAATQRRLSFDYGLRHWNGLVFNYVPAQVLGDEFKQSLMFPLDRAAYQEFGYVHPYGSTATGMTDSFGSFWWFGCLKFFVIAFLMAKLYTAAADGNLTAQVLFIIMIRPAMESFTHGTGRFVSPWVHMAMFLLPVLLWARVRVVERRVVPGTEQNKRRRPETRLAPNAAEGT